MIHELVHAMGYDDHDDAFVARQRSLLKKYAPVNKTLIQKQFVV
jgi:ssRNA-specific RNase YbeY (16S rRNA maturation enzyme)